MKKRDQRNLVHSGRWTAYAAAGAAAAVGTGGAAEADIYYSGTVNIAVVDTNSTDTYFTFVNLFTLQGGTNLILTPAHNFYGGTNQGIAAIYQGVRGSENFGPGQVAGQNFSGFGYVSKLGYGQNISTLPFLTSGNRQYMAWLSGLNYPNSQFLAPGTSYVGFQFDIGNGTQYGWMQVEMSGADRNTWKIIDYAYADAGQAITAGLTAIPEAGSMGLLALGGLGLVLWRKRRGMQISA